jgi:hypothetical protein
LDLFGRQSHRLAAVRLLTLPQVPYECGKVAAALLENLFSDLPNLVHDWITHFSFSQQLLGCTDTRTSVSSANTRPIPKFEDRQVPVSDAAGPVLRSAAILALINVVLFAAAFVSFLRYDVR